MASGVPREASPVDRAPVDFWREGAVCGVELAPRESRVAGLELAKSGVGPCLTAAPGPRQVAAASQNQRQGPLGRPATSEKAPAKARPVGPCRCLSPPAIASGVEAARLCARRMEELPARGIGTAQSGPKARQLGSFYMVRGCVRSIVYPTEKYRSQAGKLPGRQAKVVLTTLGLSFDWLMRPAQILRLCQRAFGFGVPVPGTQVLALAQSESDLIGCMDRWVRGSAAAILSALRSNSTPCTASLELFSGSYINQTLERLGKACLALVYEISFQSL